MSGSNPLAVALGQVGQSDPFKTANALMNLQKGAYDIRTQQANQAIGGILQQATDQNGNVDYEMAGRLAAQAGPQVQLGMQSYLANASQQRGQQLAQGVTRNAAASNAIIGALQGDDDGLHDRVVGGLQGLVSNGVMTQDQATRSALRLPSDPTQLRQRLQQVQTSLAPPDLQQQQISGRPFTYTAPGGVLAGGTQSLQTGGVQTPPQQGAPQGLDPAQTAEYQRWLKSPRDYPDPSDPNTTKHGTNETYLTDSGVPRQYIYPGGAPATPGTQPTQSPLGTGRLPSTLLNPNRPQATPAAPGGTAAAPGTTPAPSPVAPAPAVLPAAAGTGIRGPTPAQAAAGQATVEQGKLGPPQFQAEAAADTQAQNQQAILGNMLSDTSQFTTGPLAGIVGKVRNLAGNLGLNINTEAQSAKESFNKLAAGLANAQGAGSDARMNVNISANPHEELSPAGVDLILRQLQGNADYVRARASLAAKYPNKADYPGFQQSISGLDPRVFQMARMTADQRQTYWGSLDSNARRQIDAAGKEAQRLGVLGG